MRTPAQIEASRRNGAKSKGPASPEGRARSSQNAITHGLASHKLMVIEGESTEQWQDLLLLCEEEFRPETGLEAELVLQIAAARWRLRRSMSVETAMIDIELANNRKSFDENFPSDDHQLRHAAAIQKIVSDVNLLDRYETRARRSFDTAVKALYDLRARRRSREKAENCQTNPTTGNAIEYLDKHF